MGLEMCMNLVKRKKNPFHNQSLKDVLIRTALRFVWNHAWRAVQREDMHYGGVCGFKKKKKHLCCLLAVSGMFKRERERELGIFGKCLKSIIFTASGLSVVCM